MRLPTMLALLMAAQAALGLLLPLHYRDPAWIRAAWFANDGVTLLVAVPLLLLALQRTSDGSAAWRPVLLGLLGFAIYNYAYYLLGAALNVWFPLYLGLLLLAVAAFAAVVAGLPRMQPDLPARAAARARAAGAALLLIGTGLAVVWLVMWGAYVFAGRPTPVAPEFFRLIAALDLVLMAPPLIVGGILLYRRSPWGAMIAAAAGVQGALYLLVLCAGSAVAVVRGLVAPPGEVPIWSALLLATSSATAVVLRCGRPREAGLRYGEEMSNA